MSPTVPPAGALRVLVVTATVLLATLLLLGAGAPAAHAHTELVRTWPPAGATDEPVHEVQLRFVEALAEGLAQVAVTGPGGSVTSGDPVVTGSDVAVPLRPLTEAGTYTVAFRVVASDGHPVVGQFGVTVSPTSAAAAAKQVAAAEKRAVAAEKRAAAAEKKASAAAKPAPAAKTPSSGPEGAGPASRGPRSGAPEQLLSAGSGAPVAQGGLDLVMTAGGVAALGLLLVLHLLLRRNGVAVRETS